MRVPRSHGPFGEKLAHCKGSASSIKVHYYNKTDVKHWRHGSPEDDSKSPAFTPHATEDQIKKCELCIAIDHSWFCNSYESHQAWWKQVFRHEAVHWGQYARWPLWRVRSEDIFNYPYPGTGSAEGKNGNPGGVATDENYKADQCARKLLDAFDDCRTQYTEMEALLFGNARAGCDGPSYWYQEHDVKGETKPPGLDTDMKKVTDCKEKLFGDPANSEDGGAVGAAQAKVTAAGAGNAAAYAKLQAFIDKLNAAKTSMCEDINALADELAKAKAKYEERQD